MKTFFLFLIFCNFFTSIYATPRVDDPTQSITYWQKYTIDAADSDKVRVAEQVFARLIRAWGHNKQFLPPKLYVVNAESGPWAAALADGNILISLEALNIALLENDIENQHQLAFVLAHELAHQQHDDMWHYKFLRLVGMQAPETQALIAKGLQLDIAAIKDLQNREAKADEAAIFMMAMVGFDPFAIVANKNFFEQWVEHVWDTPCQSKYVKQAVFEACGEAKTRAARIMTRLNDVSQKALFVELGMQSYVAGKYSQARTYFSLFEREYSSAAVLNNIGLTYLAELTELKFNIVGEELPLSLNFYYPLMLSVMDFSLGAKTRSAPHSNELKNINALTDRNVEKAVELFERAIKISPDSQSFYINLAIAYLLQNNTFMARGVVQGKYEKRFGQDQQSRLLLAITSILEEKPEVALLELEHLNAELNTDDYYLKFAINANLALLHLDAGQADKEKNTWVALVRESQKTGSSLMMQVARTQLRKENTRNLRFLSDVSLPNSLPVKEESLLVNGEPLFYVNYTGGKSFVVDDQKNILFAWQAHTTLKHNNGIVDTGAKEIELLKKVGVPDRLIATMRGVFYAYDSLKMGFRVEEGKVVGWFYF